ncbi:MAG: ABC transporter substrate-binding protein [Betaproteobacteria bacterium]|nr:ABC transporter substrate-binding protein [Betaproteobacteria bacterium]
MTRLIRNGVFATALVTFLLAATGSLAADPGTSDPPWSPPPEGGVNFTIHGIDNAPDLHGDINDPQLTVFFAGNQYMVVHDLIDAFRSVHPEYRRIFVETLPPGILARQMEQGSLVVGNMRITVQPDVYTAGRGRMETLQRDRNWFVRTEPYARNRLAIMTALGNPHGIAGWSDLADPGITVCMPNPEWEGIAKNVIIPAIRTTGGDALVRKIYEDKAREKSTHLTQIHHRQTPLWIMQGKCEAGAVWYTEAYFHATVKHHPVSLVTLPDDQNRTATYVAGRLRDAPHPEAADAFLDFLVSAEGQAIYRRYGFLPPAP